VILTSWALADGNSYADPEAETSLLPLPCESPRQFSQMLRKYPPLPAYRVSAIWANLSRDRRQCAAFAQELPGPVHCPQIAFCPDGSRFNDLIKYTRATDSSSIAIFRACTGMPAPDYDSAHFRFGFASNCDEDQSSNMRDRRFRCARCDYLIVTRQCE
jgi:hypothetical protein